MTFGKTWDDTMPLILQPGYYGEFFITEDGDILAAPYPPPITRFEKIDFSTKYERAVRSEQEDDVIMGFQKTGQGEVLGVDKPKDDQPDREVREAEQQEEDDREQRESHGQ